MIIYHQNIINLLDPIRPSIYSSLDSLDEWLNKFDRAMDAQQQQQ